MKKKLPWPERLTHLTVDGVTVRVQWLKHIGTFAAGYEQGGDYGQNVIRLIKGQTRNGVRATMLHELMHHCIERSGIKLASREEERIIGALDSFLLAALRENPELVAFLTEEDS